MSSAGGRARTASEPHHDEDNADEREESPVAIARPAARRSGRPPTRGVRISLPAASSRAPHPRPPVAQAANAADPDAPSMQTLMSNIEQQLQQLLQAVGGISSNQGPDQDQAGDDEDFVAGAPAPRRVEQQHSSIPPSDLMTHIPRHKLAWKGGNEISALDIFIPITSFDLRTNTFQTENTLLNEYIDGLFDQLLQFEFPKIVSNKRIEIEKRKNLKIHQKFYEAVSREKIYKINIEPIQLGFNNDIDYSLTFYDFEQKITKFFEKYIKKYNAQLLLIVSKQWLKNTIYNIIITKYFTASLKFNLSTSSGITIIIKYELYSRDFDINTFDYKFDEHTQWRPVYLKKVSNIIDTFRTMPFDSISKSSIMSLPEDIRQSLLQQVINPEMKKQITIDDMKKITEQIMNEK